MIERAIHLISELPALLQFALSLWAFAIVLMIVRAFVPEHSRPEATKGLLLGGYMLALVVTL